MAYTAGELDGTFGLLRARAYTLAQAGVDARFLSLGHVGHFLPPQTSALVGQLIDWARGDAE